MRIVLLSSLLFLAACVPPTVEQYKNNPNKRMVNIDDAQVSVVDVGWGHYMAWGGTKDKESVMRYRQKRAIELVSGCRVGKGMSQAVGELLQATVSC